MMVAGVSLTSEDLKTFGLAAAAGIVWYQNRKQTQKVQEVKNTLTTRNGGSHVKDQLDRIESQQEATTLRLDRQDRNQMRLENKLNAHLDWSSEMVDAMKKQISEQKRKNNG